MARVGDVFELHDGEKVTVRTASADSEGALLEVEAQWAPASHKPLAHLHPSQDEHFELLEGELTANVGGERRVLNAGDTLDIPRGTRHTMWNSGSAPARASWQVRPALRTEQFFQSVHELRAAGHKGKGGMIDLPASALVVREFSAEFQPAVSSVVRGPLFAALAAWARLRGYRTAG